METKQLVHEIKQRIDLVDYVSREVNLQRSGKSLRGHCPHPNHRDTNPSFVVGLDRHGAPVASCFGCGKTSMDIIGYVQWRHNINFSEAISLLANELGLEYEPARPANTHALLADIVSLGQQILRKSSTAMAYLTQKRCLSASVIEQAQLGFIDDGYAFIKNLRELGYSWRDLEKVGFVSKQSRRCRFVNRILIPVWSQTGISAIAGRQLTDDGKYVRYLYTETQVPPVYSVGLEPSYKPLLLVEGLMDLLSAQTLGAKYSLALTSAATANHPALDDILQQYPFTYCLLHEDQAGEQALTTLRARYSDRIVPVHLPLGYADINDALAAGKDRQWLETLLRSTLPAQAS